MRLNVAQKRRRSTRLTRLTHTHLQDLVCRRLLAKVVIEGQHPVHICARNIQGFSDRLDTFLRHVTIKVLDVVEEWQEALGLIGVLRQQWLN